jgi:hypothetical protein
MDSQIETLDCACVLYGSAYSWAYVERLQNMLQRNLSLPVRLHVYTEIERTVPSPMIKHVLTEWPDVRPGRAWWYKMQLFNPAHFAGPMLYFDLDTVLVNKIDWIWQKPCNYFWTVRDFKYLWRKSSTSINSSVMWWDTRQFSYVWEQFAGQNRNNIMLKYRGDQDFITSTIAENQRRFFELERVKSWRWECADGGYDFNKRRHRTPGTGTQYSPDTSVLVFHGQPKPSEIQDPVILKHWQ